MMELTKEKCDEIISKVPEAYTVQQLARLCQLPYPVLIIWLKRGYDHLKEEVDSVYRSLFCGVELATGKVIQANLQKIQNHNSYQAAAWFLENCYPEQFGENAPKIQELKAIVKELINKGIIDQKRLTHDF